MVKFKLSKAAESDLIRIHHYGVETFGVNQADKYFYEIFNQFEIIAERPYSFEAVNYIKKGYRRCVCGSDSIYFKVKDDIVEIMTIIGKQDVDNI